MCTVITNVLADAACHAIQERAMKTSAAVAHSLRSPFVVEDVELPDLQHTDVLVRIVAVGICHTDIASRDGQLAAPFPTVFGHEGAGVVERIGGRVNTVV